MTALTREEATEYPAFAEHFISDADIEAEIRYYEELFSMSSAEFMEKWEQGTAPDTSETNSWAILLDFR